MRLKVIYIEDQIFEQKTFHYLLKALLPHEFFFDTAQTASEGLRKIGESDYDLIILDYRLPDMTGLDVLKELRRRDSGVPVIFLTGSGDEKTVVEAMKLGANDYISKKDLDIVSLREVLKDIILENAFPPDLPLENIKLVADIFSRSQTIEIQVSSSLICPQTGETLPNDFISTLDKLAENGLVEKKPSQSVVLCPTCGSLGNVLLLRCPECNSPKGSKGEVLEHSTCGHVDFRDSFKVGEDLVCPKCEKKLMQIGVDYSKVGNLFSCDGKHFFNIPILGFKCTDCYEEFNIDSSFLKPISQYSLTKKGQIRLGMAQLKLGGDDSIYPDNLEANENILEIG